MPDWLRASLAGAAAMFVCMALGRFSFSTMIPALIDAQLLTAVQAGLIGGSNLCGFLAGAFASLRLSSYTSIEKLIRIVVWLAVVALFASAVPAGGYWLGGWRLVLGACAGIVMVLCLTLATRLAPARYRAAASAIVFSGVGTGILFCGAAVPQLLTRSLSIAWTGIALVALVAALICHYALRPPKPVQHQTVRHDGSAPKNLRWYLLVSGSVLFSFGIVPHTIYWFDFLSRELQLGHTLAGWHWIVIGMAGVAGPLLAALTASVLGNRRALVAGFITLAIGVALPAGFSGSVALWISTCLFGLQPAVSALITTRVRDLGNDRQLLPMVRLIILANGAGAALGGMVIPVMYKVLGASQGLFVAGATSFVLGAVACAWPLQIGQKKGSQT